MNLKEIGRKIKSQRQYIGLTQEQLSELVNITPAYLSGIESGNKVASIKVMLAIANELDMSLDYMLLNDIKNDSDHTKIDCNIIEFKHILKELNDRDLIDNFVAYSRAISKEMINRKTKKN